MEFKFHFEKYRGQFSALVLNHMKSQLPTDEWTLLRGLCTGLSMVNEPVRLDATQEEVLADSLCETVLDPSESRKCPFSMCREKGTTFGGVTGFAWTLC